MPLTIEDALSDIEEIQSKKTYIYNDLELLDKYKELAELIEKG